MLTCKGRPVLHRRLLRQPWRVPMQICDLRSPPARGSYHLPPEQSHAAVLASAQTLSNVGISTPRMAAIPPGLSSPARFISSPRVRTSLSPSEKDNAPEAVRADNSPRECPATVAGLKSGSMKRKCPPRGNRMDVQRGLRIDRLIQVHPQVHPTSTVKGESRGRNLLHRNVSLATGYVSASSLPMPTACEPCPGNTNAVVCGFRFMMYSQWSGDTLPGYIEIAM